jgi:hypothetical protein
MIRNCATALLLLLAACDDDTIIGGGDTKFDAPGDGASDGGGTGDGSADDGGGGVQFTPGEFPVIRMEPGGDFDHEVQGVAEALQSVPNPPFAGITDRLPIRKIDGNREYLYFTLPAPYFMNVGVNKPVRVFYRERHTEAGGGTYGAVISEQTSGVILFAAEEARSGRFLPPEQLSGVVLSDGADELRREIVGCYERVWFRLIFTSGANAQELLPGTEGALPIGAANYRAIALRNYKNQNATCGSVPAAESAWLLIKSP